jgi:hypothetical protein
MLASNTKEINMKKTFRFDKAEHFFKDLDESKILGRLHYFKCRWEDEKEYENFEEYKDAIIKLFNPYDIKQLKIKENFEIEIYLNNMKFILKINKTSIKYKAAKITA